MDNHTAVNQSQGPDGAGDPTPTADCPEDNYLCCAGVHYFEQTFTNPYPDDPAIFTFVGGVDDDFAYKRDSDVDWVIYQENASDNANYSGSGCNGAHPVNFCAQLLAGESIKIAAVNNFDEDVGIGGDVYICKGTSLTAIPTADGAARMPSLLKRAGNAGKALIRSINVVRAKQPLLATSDEAVRRLAICKACPMLDPTKVICTHANCGCYLKVKTYLRAEHCPLENPKW